MKKLTPEESKEALFQVQREFIELFKAVNAAYLPLVAPIDAALQDEPVRLDESFLSDLQEKISCIERGAQELSDYIYDLTNPDER